MDRPKYLAAVGALALLAAATCRPLAAQPAPRQGPAAGGTGRAYARATIPSVEGIGYLVLRGGQAQWKHARGVEPMGWKGVVGAARPRTGERVVVQHSGPGRVRVVQQPWPENDHTTVLVVPDVDVTWRAGQGDVWEIPHEAGAVHAIELFLVAAAAHDDARRVPGELEQEQRRAQMLGREGRTGEAMEAWMRIALQARTRSLRALALEEWTDLHRRRVREPSEADLAKLAALRDVSIREFYGEEGVVLTGESVMLLWPRHLAEHPAAVCFLAQLDLAYAALVDLSGQNPCERYGRRLCFVFLASGAHWADHHVVMGLDEFGHLPPFNTVFYHEMGHDFFKYPTEAMTPESSWGEGWASFAQIRALEVVAFDPQGLARLFDQGERLLDRHLTRGDGALGPTGAYFMGATTLASFGVRGRGDNGIVWDWDAYRRLLWRFAAAGAVPTSPRDRYRHFAATFAAEFGPGVYDRFQRIGYPVARADAVLVPRERGLVLPMLSRARDLAASGDLEPARRIAEQFAASGNHLLRGEATALLATLRARMGHDGGARAAAAQLGIVRDWWIHEPTVIDSDDALSQVTPGEVLLGLAPRPSVVGGRPGHEWIRLLAAPPPAGAPALHQGGFRQVRAEALDGVVDLKELLAGTGRPESTLAVTILTSDRAQLVDLRLGQDDDSAVYLNGRQLARIPAFTSVNPDQFWVPLPLLAGHNVLALKIANRAGDWGFVARVTGPDGLAAQGVRSSMPRPAPTGAVAGGESRRVLWRLGAEDGRSDDLAPARHTQNWKELFPDGVSLDPTGNGASRAFSEIQPGPNDAWAGNDVHTFTLRFPLQGRVDREHELVLATVGQNGWTPPRLTVAVNGSETTFELPGSPDEVLHDFDRGTPSRLRLRLPPGLMRRGTNTIQLSIRQGSWVLYDALEMVRLAGS